MYILSENGYNRDQSLALPCHHCRVFQKRCRDQDRRWCQICDLCVGVFLLLRMPYLKFKTFSIDLPVVFLLPLISQIGEWAFKAPISIISPIICSSYSYSFLNSLASYIVYYDEEYNRSGLFFLLINLYTLEFQFQMFRIRCQQTFFVLEASTLTRQASPPPGPSLGIQYAL